MPPKKKGKSKSVSKDSVSSRKKTPENDKLLPVPPTNGSSRQTSIERSKTSSVGRRKSVAASIISSSRKVKEIDIESSDSTVVESSSDDEERWKERTFKQSDLPSEYWHIQKLVKYMKAGNQTATVVALCCLKDHDLTTQINQTAIQEIGGLEILVNLLESNDLKCRFGSLSVLSTISTNMDIRRSIVDLGGIPLLVNILSEPARDLKILAAETIANVSKVRLARKLVRKFGGIPKVVDLLDVSGE